MQIRRNLTPGTPSFAGRSKPHCPPTEREPESREWPRHATRLRCAALVFLMMVALWSGCSNDDDPQVGPGTPERVVLDVAASSEAQQVIGVAVGDRYYVRLGAPVLDVQGEVLEGFESVAVFDDESATDAPVAILRFGGQANLNRIELQDGASLTRIEPSSNVWIYLDGQEGEMSLVWIPLPDAPRGSAPTRPSDLLGRAVTPRSPSPVLIIQSVCDDAEIAPDAVTATYESRTLLGSRAGTRSLEVKSIDGRIVVIDPMWSVFDVWESFNMCTAVFGVYEIATRSKVLLDAVYISQSSAPHVAFLIWAAKEALSVVAHGVVEESAGGCAGVVVNTHELAGALYTDALIRVTAERGSQRLEQVVDLRMQSLPAEITLRWRDDTAHAGVAWDSRQLTAHLALYREDCGKLASMELWRRWRGDWIDVSDSHAGVAAFNSLAENIAIPRSWAVPVLPCGTYEARFTDPDGAPLARTPAFDTSDLAGDVPFGASVEGATSGEENDEERKTSGGVRVAREDQGGVVIASIRHERSKRVGSDVSRVVVEFPRGELESMSVSNCACRQQDGGGDAGVFTVPFEAVGAVTVHCSWPDGGYDATIPNARLVGEVRMSPERSYFTGELRFNDSELHPELCLRVQSPLRIEFDSGAGLTASGRK